MSVASVGSSVGAGVKKPSSSSSSDDKPSVSSTAVKVASAAAPAVKTASPTTSTAVKTQNYSSNESSGTGNRANSGSGGLSAAAGNVGGGGGNGNGGNGSNSSGNGGVNAAAKTASQGVSRRLTSDNVDKSEPNWDMLQELTAGSFDNAAPSTGARPFRAEYDPTLSEPGTGLDWAGFSRNVNNGSLGMPGAAGYGLDYTPGAPITFDPMRQDTAAMERSLTATPNASGGFGIDFGGIGTALVDNAHRNQALREANPPLAGLADAVPGLREFAASPAAYRQDSPVTAPAVQTAGIDPKLAARQKYETWQDPWGQLAAATRTAAIPDRLAPDNMAVTALADAPAGNAALGGIDAAAGPSPAELALDEKVFGGGAPNDVFSTDGQMTTADGTVLNSGVDNSGGTPITVRGGASEAPTPSKWDSVVDNTGKLLSHTGLGGIVSTLFPDMWSGMGDAFKGMDNGTGKSGQMIDGETMTRMINGGRDPFLGDSRGTTYDNNGAPDGAVAQAAVAAAFPDVNHNGIDDRLEGTDATGYSGNQYRSNRYATFPDMPPYKPGVDNEWNYFRDHLARGGVVGYADGGAVGLGAPDPRVTAIADAEDALHAGRTDDPAVAKFAELFGPSALKQLRGHVGEGYSMRPRGRMVTGPGGPTDDAVPAVIDGVHPAKLSSGEFVLPVSAVEGIGGGDAKVGADRLHALVERFAAK